MWGPHLLIRRKKYMQCGFFSNTSFLNRISGHPKIGISGHTKKSHSLGAELTGVFVGPSNTAISAGATLQHPSIPSPAFPHQAFH
jgi:hypothetical protein